MGPREGSEVSEMSGKAPRHLSAPTRRWYEFIISEYALESHHLKLLEACCESWDRMKQAAAELKKDGLTFQDAKGMLRTHPCVAIERDSRNAFMRALRELALDRDEAPEAPRPSVLTGTGNLKR